MYMLHNVGSDDCMKIRLHKIEHKVNIFVVLGLEDIEQRDDIRMPVQFLQEDDLS